MYIFMYTCIYVLYISMYVDTHIYRCLLLKIKFNLKVLPRVYLRETLFTLEGVTFLGDQWFPS